MMRFGTTPSGSFMSDHLSNQYLHTRRRFLTRTSACLGMTAVASLLDPTLLSGGSQVSPLPPGEGPGVRVPGVLGRTHFAPKAKNVIYLFMGGGPSHADTFDPKPILLRRHGHELPASALGTQRVTLL